MKDLSSSVPLLLPQSQSIRVLCDSFLIAMDTDTEIRVSTIDLQLFQQNPHWVYAVTRRICFIRVVLPLLGLLVEAVDDAEHGVAGDDVAPVLGGALRIDRVGDMG